MARSACGLRSGGTFLQSGVAVVCVVFLVAATGAHCTLTQSEKTDLLQRHNSYRVNVSPRACPPLPLMVWNETLATVAQAYADRCIWGHNANRTIQQQPRVFSTVGENLYLSSKVNSDVGHAVSSWNAEVADYTLSSNTCAAGKVCGHYTQVVWRSSVGLGCGAAHCVPASTQGLPASFQRSSKVLIVVCNYGPSGNFHGQAPYSTQSCPTTTQPAQEATTTQPAQEASATQPAQGTMASPAPAVMSTSAADQSTGLPRVLLLALAVTIGFAVITMFAG